MSPYYFWLGIAAEDYLPPEADEDAEYEQDGDSWHLVEGDGFRTVWPLL